MLISTFTFFKACLKLSRSPIAILVHRQKCSISSLSAWGFWMRRLATIGCWLFFVDASHMPKTRRIPPKLKGFMSTVTETTSASTISSSTYVHLFFFLCLCWINLHRRLHLVSRHRGSKGMSNAADLNGVADLSPELLVMVAAMEVKAWCNWSGSIEEVWKVPPVTSAKERKWCQCSDWEPKATACNSKLLARCFCKSCLSKRVKTVRFS